VTKKIYIQAINLSKSSKPPTIKPRNEMQRNQQTKIYRLLQSFVTTMYLDAGGRPEEIAPNDF
jgi:hypothetical protein